MMWQRKIAEPSEFRLDSGNASRSRWMILFFWAAIFGLAYSAKLLAQVTTNHSYNGANCISTAITSTGTGVQYLCDAGGSTTSLVSVTPQSLTLGSPYTVTFSSSSGAGLLSMSVATGQILTLTESSLAISPSVDAVTIDVFNTSGAWRAPSTRQTAI